MPVSYLSDPNAQDDAFEPVSRSFRILYRELWKRGDSDETEDRRQVFIQSRISIPDYENLKNSMQSSAVKVDSSSGGIVEDDDDDAAAALASIDPDVPRIPFDYTRLDLSWLPATIVRAHRSLLSTGV
ncbi:hypothetical protein SCP_1700480 [Sparassis crispa]|uniref:Uncharacterized protein n=1 Tax=Sparassis crispa TaxID=139825 RepID=A0A401H5N3_9APHY|nr:hypothetical protein SCP_1700480 [Sparassis crispa]GBE89724.1 hypothetical protein SCP_1700480 [Sparassis crispa]